VSVEKETSVVQMHAPTRAFVLGQQDLAFLLLCTVR
jgi:hypothetical protein